MKNKKTLIILVVVFVALLGGAGLLYNQLKDSVGRQELAGTEDKKEDEAAGEKEEEQSPAPDFTVYDQEGKEVHLSDYVGKPIVLNFWSSSCGPCKSEMPDFDEAYKEYGDQVQFMMVNITDGSRETKESAFEFINSQGFTFPVFFDTSFDATPIYVKGGIPITYFIDAEGYGVAYGQGALSREALQQGIDMLLK